MMGKYVGSVTEQPISLMLRYPLQIGIHSLQDYITMSGCLGPKPKIVTQAEPDIG